MSQQRESLLGGKIGKDHPFSNFIDWILPIFSLSLLLLTRRHFGPQYVSAGRIVGAIIVPPLFVKFLMMLSNQPTLAQRFGTDVFVWILTIAGIWRLLEIKHKEFNGERWYSNCRGISFKFWRKVPVLQHFPYFVQCWIEPGFWFFVGYVLSYTRFGNLAIFFMFASLMLFFEERLAQKKMLQEWWHGMDGHIQSDQMRRSVLENIPPEETEGFWNPMASRLDLKSRLRFIAREEDGHEDFLKRLDALVEEKGLPNAQVKESKEFAAYFKPLVNRLKKFLQVDAQKTGDDTPSTEEEPPPLDKSNKSD